MATGTKNDFFDVPSEDESGSDAGYDSEAADLKPALRARKRRRVSRDDEDDSASASGGELDAPETELPEDEDEADTSASAPKKPQLHDDEDNHTASATSGRPARKLRQAPTKPKEKSKPGVVYLSRIPPFMKPSVLRTYLAPYAPKHGLHRLFLTPEPPTQHAARVRAGGNKKRMFSDGWVEFRSKREAKAVVAALNARIVGGKKGGWYHDDVWNMRYLRGFRWDDLMGQMRAENAERDGRMRAELAQSARENARFLAGVEQAKAINGMEEKRRAKRARNGTGGAEEDGESKARMMFRQNVVKDKRAAAKTLDRDRPVEEPQDDVQRVLGNIF